MYSGLSKTPYGQYLQLEYMLLWQKWQQNIKDCKGDNLFDKVGLDHCLANSNWATGLPQNYLKTLWNLKDEKMRLK